jgi:flagellar biosynthesis/type III secretory pathway protein FliH
MPVVRIRVAACDVAACALACDVTACDVVRVAAMASRDGGVAVVEDAALSGGDAIVELAGGALDARLGVRLATVLEAFA